MATIKVVIRQKKNKDGSYPLALRITKNRETSFLYLGHNIDPIHWDSDSQRVKKSHPNSKRLNNLIIQKLAEHNNKLLEMEVQNTDASSNAIKKGLKSVNGAHFFPVANTYIQNLANGGKYNQSAADEPRINIFKEFIKEHEKRNDITFPEITVQLLKNFRAYLKRERDVAERTIINYLVVIRTVYNQAKTAKLVDPKYYPFGKGKIAIKFPQSIKIGLTPEEVKILEEIELPAKLNDARNKWLFSFYFAGMRISDVLRLKWTDFQDNRLHYSMGKNTKAGSLKVPEKVLRILAQYKGRDAKHDLVFPDLEKLEHLKDKYQVERAIATIVNGMNKDLRKVAKAAEIEKSITTHIARHTFGNISGDRISIQMLQKLYRHADIKTTLGYQANFIHKDADDALDAVIDF